jgi:hypothetical protein
MPDDDREKRPTPTFQESAKKFKPGPVSPPEREEDRPDMAGGRRGGEPRPVDQRGAEAMEAPGDQTGELVMTEGEPGKTKKMPEE